jgi:hypothetical protein
LTMFSCHIVRSVYFTGGATDGVTVKKFSITIAGLLLQTFDQLL